MNFKCFNRYIIVYITIVALARAPRLRQKRSLAFTHLNTWTDGVVPYVIRNNSNPNTTDDAFSALDYLLIRKAMDTIEKETCVKFIEIDEESNSSKLPYLEISGRNDRHCYATLGMSSEEKNEMILNSLCRTVGQILHELAHVLGLLHELMRPDRDKYIILHEENIAKDYKQEFDMQPSFYTKLWDRTFDFQSVTLYDPFNVKNSPFQSFTMGSKPVWEPRGSLDNTPLFPLREKDLSFEDAAAINRLYDCAAKCSTKRRPCRETDFMNKNCRCETAESYAYRRCRDDREYRNFCSTAIETNKCYDKSSVAIPFCRKTCGRCFRAGIFGKSFPPIKKCIDLEPAQCLRLISEGYCYFDAWTKIHCQQSCGLCPPPAIAKRQTYSLDAREYLRAHRTGECYNRFDDLKCMIFAESGHCEKNPSFMTGYCALSCGNCGNRTTTDLSYLHIAMPGCQNLIDDERCNALAREGKCRGITLKQCRLACEECVTTTKYLTPLTSTPTTLTTPSTTTYATTKQTNNVVNRIPLKRSCEDKSTMCPWLAEYGHCITKRQRMEDLCPMSCNFCLGECVDLDPIHVCEDFKQRGYCKYGVTFAVRCIKTCGLCEKQLQRRNYKISKR